MIQKARLTGALPLHYKDARTMATHGSGMLNSLIIPCESRKYEEVVFRRSEERRLSLVLMGHK